MSENEGSSGTVAKVVVVVVAVAVAGFGLIWALSGDDDADDDTAEVTDDTATDDTATDGDATEGDTSDEGATAGDEAAESPATGAGDSGDQVVIGTDENGDDIVVEFEITGACAQTFHTPIDEASFSHIAWEFTAPGLADGTEVTIRFSDESVTTASVTAGSIEIDQGITSYGSYAFPTVEWAESDDVESSIVPDGEHLVDETEGDASETCLG